MKTKLLYVCVFIMIFFSSILGGKIFGFSLNKLCILPLYIYLVVSVFGTYGRIKIRMRLVPLLLFYLISAVSALYSLTADYSNIEGYTSRSTFYAVQAICIYIPLIILLYNYNRKDLVINAAEKAVIFTYRLNILIAFLEFVSFFVFDVTLTQMILSIFYGTEAVPPLINLPPLGIFIRPTGLNMDAAYLGIILAFGFVFDKDRKWKLAAFLIALIAMSRTAIIVMAAVYFYDRGFKKPTKKSLLLTLAGIGFIIFLLITSNGFRGQMIGLMDRFNFSSQASSEDPGTMRHLLYIPKSAEVLLFKYTPAQMLIGFGPRQSGTIMAHSGVMDAYLNNEMFFEPWSLECDVGELLLGYGIVGTILYYRNIYGLRKFGKHGKKLFLIAALYSIMYDISAATFAQLIIIIYLCCADKVVYSAVLSLSKKPENMETELNG